MSKIFVTNLKEINNNSVKCVCDVFIEAKNMTLNGVLLIEKGNNRWIKLPSNKWESDGEMKFQEMIAFTNPIEDKTIREGIKTAILQYGKQQTSPITENKNQEIENLPF